jgi:hypothetical protein
MSGSACITLIVDDESLARERIRNISPPTPDSDHRGVRQRPGGNRSYSIALARLVFLDVEMPGSMVSACSSAPRSNTYHHLRYGI